MREPSSGTGPEYAPERVPLCWAHAAASSAVFAVVVTRIPLPGVHNIAVQGYVGVTDQNWYEFLAERKDITEVNFWRPKDKRRFRVISPGEFFFFKTHAPDSRIVGGGILAGWELLPLSAAWAFYGPGNGAASLGELRALIGGREGLRPGEDPEIGCILLHSVTFFPPGTSMALPPGLWSSGIQQGKSFNLADQPYAPFFDLITTRVLSTSIEIDLNDSSWRHSGPMFRERLRSERIGQGAFQARVLNAYHRRCAITGTKIWPALEAAHVRPVTKGGEHRLDNGVLLRSDVHRMFDWGYLGVDPSYRLRVSPRLRDEFGNGEQFYAQAGQLITLPDRKGDRPHREFLEWHLDTVFKTS
jgi:putative restriction endonuclease